MPQSDGQDFILHRSELGDYELLGSAGGAVLGDLAAGRQAQAPLAAAADDDDWLYSDDELPPTQSALFNVSAAADLANDADDACSAGEAHNPDFMGQRDTHKVLTHFEDAGYREGITVGKLSTLQQGFDEGFETVGVPLGRRVGNLRGKLDVLAFACRQLTAQHASSSPSKRAHRVEGSESSASEADDQLASSAAEVALDDAALLTSPLASSASSPVQHLPATSRKGDSPAGVADAPVLSGGTLPIFSAHEQSPIVTDALQELKASLARLQSVVASKLTLAQVSEPDWEALEHEQEHAREASQRPNQDGLITHQKQRPRPERSTHLSEAEEEVTRMEQLMGDLLSKLQSSASITKKASKPTSHGRNASEARIAATRTQAAL